LNTDVHCHFDQLPVELLVKEIEKNRVVAVAVDYNSGEKLLEYKKIYKNLNICLGIHPEYPEKYDDYEKVERQIRENTQYISGIGEIGMPYFNLPGLENNKEREKVLEKAGIIFVKFLKLAAELKLPVNLHCIENSGEYAVRKLEKYNIKKALFHWFEGEEKTLESIKENGWNISISPDVIYNKKYEDFVRKIPLEIITLESDGPWEYGGKTGVPSMVEKTAEFLASVYKKSKEEILIISNKNADILFNL
jgi:TatD DNase family protein